LHPPPPTLSPLPPYAHTPNFPHPINPILPYYTLPTSSTQIFPHYPPSHPPALSIPQIIPLLTNGSHPTYSLPQPTHPQFSCLPYHSLPSEGRDYTRRTPASSRLLRSPTTSPPAACLPRQSFNSTSPYPRYHPLPPLPVPPFVRLLSRCRPDSYITPRRSPYTPPPVPTLRFLSLPHSPRLCISRLPLSSPPSLSGRPSLLAKFTSTTARPSPAIYRLFLSVCPALTPPGTPPTVRLPCPPPTEPGSSVSRLSLGLHSGISRPNFLFIVVQASNRESIFMQE